MSANTQQWLTIVGLLFDLVGAFFIAWGVLVSRRTAIDISVPRFAGETDEENAKLPQVQDRLRQARLALIGLGLLIIGFALQIVGSWPL